MRFKLITLLISCCFVSLQAQSGEELYQKRITQESINGVYIPKDLNDAFVQLSQLIDKTSKQKFKSVDEVTAARKLHFSLGRWIILNWGFYEGSRLSHSIKKMGLSYPDDMARLIIIAYHRSLNRNKLQIKELVSQIAERRAQLIEEEQRRNGKVLHSETRQRPRPTKNNK